MKGEDLGRENWRREFAAGKSYQIGFFRRTKLEEEAALPKTGDAGPDKIWFGDPTNSRDEA